MRTETRRREDQTCEPKSGRGWQPPPSPSQRPPLRTPEEFHIGVVASLTGAFNGPSKDTIDGFEAWVKSRGLPGKKIVIDALDDETNPVSASNAFRKLASDPKTNIIFLNINSSSALAAKAFASEFKVPMVTGGGADALGFPPDPWMFKVAPSGHDAMTVVLQYMQKKGMKKIAHLYGTDELAPSSGSLLRPPRALPSMTPISMRSWPGFAPPIRT